MHLTARRTLSRSGAAGGGGAARAGARRGAYGYGRAAPEAERESVCVLLGPRCGSPMHAARAFTVFVASQACPACRTHYTKSHALKSKRPWPQLGSRGVILVSRVPSSEAAFGCCWLGRCPPPPRCRFRHTRPARPQPIQARALALGLRARPRAAPDHARCCRR